MWGIAVAVGFLYLLSVYNWATWGSWLAPDRGFAIGLAFCGALSALGYALIARRIEPTTDDGSLRPRGDAAASAPGSTPRD